MFKDFLECYKRRFKCGESIELFKDQCVTLTKERDAQKAIADTQKALVDKLKNIPKSALFDGIPTMEEMIADGRAVRKQTADLQRLFKSQFGQILYTNPGVAMSDRNKVIWNRSLSEYLWIIPKDVFQEIMKRSVTDLYIWDNEGPRVKVCTEFAWSAYCELQSIRNGYWDVFIAYLIIQPKPEYKPMTGHAINLCWFSDEDDKLYYFEPQNDRLWVPDVEAENREPWSITT